MNYALDVLAGLRNLSACHISDGLKQIGAGGGVIHALQPVGSRTRLCGKAIPVQCTYKPAGDAERTRYGAATIPGAIGQDEVLVIDNDGRDAAVLGLIATHAIASQGGAGVVVNGGVRDVDAIDKVPLPVFSRHNVIYSGYGYVEREFADSVQMYGVTIARGDFLIGERGGLVVVPQQAAADVLEAARVIEAADLGMIEAIKRGERFVDLWAQSPRGALPFKLN